MVIFLRFVTSFWTIHIVQYFYVFFLKFHNASNGQIIGHAEIVGYYWNSLEHGALRQTTDLCGASEHITSLWLESIN